MIFFLSTSPSIETLITKPEVEDVVSPPTKSMLYLSHASLTPKYNSSSASTENLLLTAIEKVTCLGLPFMAQISDIFTAIDLYPKCFKGTYAKSK